MFETYNSIVNLVHHPVILLVMEICSPLRVFIPLLCSTATLVLLLSVYPELRSRVATAFGNLPVGVKELLRVLLHILWLSFFLILALGNQRRLMWLTWLICFCLDLCGVSLFHVSVMTLTSYNVCVVGFFLLKMLALARLVYSREWLLDFATECAGLDNLIRLGLANSPPK